MSIAKVHACDDRGWVDYLVRLDAREGDVVEQVRELRERGWTQRVLLVVPVYGIDFAPDDPDADVPAEDE